MHPRITDSKMTDMELEVMDERRNQIYADTNYSFLSQHKGWRPGKMHVFMGTPGGGKSTLARSLLRDLVENKFNQKILIWLSEETRPDFLAEFYGANGFKENPKMAEMVYIMSELELKGLTPKNILPTIRRVCEQENIKFLFFDNLTTSGLYADRRPEDQKQVCTDLKLLGSQMEIPIAAFIHTHSSISDNQNRLINMNDIRGSKFIATLCEYFYVMQRFISNERIISTIRITKSRGHVPEKHFFILNYDIEKRAYVLDKPVEFEYVKQIFGERDKL